MNNGFRNASSSSLSQLGGNSMSTVPHELSCQTCGAALPKQERECMSHLTPAVVAKLRDICARCMGQDWELQRDYVKIEQIHGGLTNYLYSCELPHDWHEPLTVPNGASAKYQLRGVLPRKVLIRIYGEVLRRNVDSMVLDSIIFTILSEKKLGPRLFGVFEGGRIEEWFESRPLKTAELADPVISPMIAHHLARLHSLEMPLNKTPTFLFTSMKRWVSEISERIEHLKASPQSHHQETRLLEEIAEVFLKFDVPKEAAWIEKIFFNSSYHFPVVFCHNDMQENNILYLENPDSPEGFRLLPIDFEYCSYNFRSFDIGNHFDEWTLGVDSTQKHGYRFNPEAYPTVQQQKAFWKSYLEAAGQAVPSDEEQWRTYLIESAFGAALSNIYWAIWSLLQHELSAIEFGFLDYAITRFKFYFEQKRSLPSV